MLKDPWAENKGAETNTHTHLHTYVVTHSCEAAPGLLGNRIDGTQGHGVIVEMFVCICTISAAKHLQQWGIVKWQLTTELQHVYADYTFFFFLILQDMIGQACFFLRTYCYFFSAINLWKLLNKKLLKKKKHLNQCQHH